MITNTCPKCHSKVFEFTIEDKTYSRCNTCDVTRPVVKGIPTHTILN